MFNHRNEPATLRQEECGDKLPHFLYRKIVELIDGGLPPAAVLVISAQGSTPQVAGARAVVEPTGRLWGTVGGGRFEGKVRRAAMEACQSQRPWLFDFPMNNHDAAIESPICGGCMSVLVDPMSARHRACFAEAALAVENRRRGCLLTRITAAPQTEVEVQWLSEDDLADAKSFPDLGFLRACMASGEAQRFTSEPRSRERSEEFFIEPVPPLPLLVIAGGGHVGQAVALAAYRVGFDVVVIDDRPEFADGSLYPPGIRTICGPVAERIASCRLDRDSFVVLASRNHRQDAAALEACIHLPIAYLGMIGSRRKIALMRKHFLDGGLATAEQFDRVRAPIGLEIGAVTVPEIAVSIVAQLIAVRRKANDA